MHNAFAFVATLVVVAAGAGGCSSTPEEPLGVTTAAVAHPGPWEIPASTLAKGDTQYVNYTSAGPWDNGSHCYGSLTPGTAILRKYLLDHFAGISSIGGYSCDQGVVHPENMGIHGTGRAIDIMIPLDGGDADNDLGDPIGNFLIENAQIIGVQYIIWDQVDWVGSHAAGDKAGPYSGTSNPHKNHLHVELSVETSMNSTPWFENEVTPPTFPSCAIAADGAVIDDDDPCITYFGSAAYWRTEQVGYDGGLHWTNAWDSDNPGNWARWNLSFAQAGSYLVEIYLEPAFAIATAVRYEVKHGGAVDTFEVNQSSGSGWVPLGVTKIYDFEAGGEQSISIFDYKKGVADNQHIAVDGLRFTRQGLPPVGGSGGAPGAGGSGGAGMAGASGQGGAKPPDAGGVDPDASPEGTDWASDSAGGCATKPLAPRTGEAMALCAAAILAGIALRRRSRCSSRR